VINISESEELEEYDEEIRNGGASSDDYFSPINVTFSAPKTISS
jgi:hypothetical protein